MNQELTTTNSFS